MWPGAGRIRADANEPGASSPGDFLTEVRLALRVTHPDVCRVFDIALLLLLLRVVLRRPGLAYAALFALVIVVSLGRPIPDVAVAFATTVLAVGILARFGVLALVVTILFWTWELVPLTTDVNSWYFVSSQPVST